MPWLRAVSTRPAAWPPPGDTQGAAASLRYARQRDPIGDTLQTALVALYLLTLALAGTTTKDVVWATLAACTMGRFPVIWRCYTVLLRDPLLWLFVAWAAWRTLSLVWSADRVAGLEELGAARVLLTPLMMWPVLDRASLFVRAFLIGVLGHNLVQLAQSLHWLGLEPDVNGRLNGFLHPIQLGALCLAAMCWYISALVNGAGARRVAITWWVTGLAAATAGLIFTGSRGPWVAAALTVPLALIVIAVRRPATRRAAALVAVVGIATVTATLPWTGGYVRHRIDQAVGDVNAAWGSGGGDFSTDVGKRLARWEGAWRLLLAHPFTGTGAGGYGQAMQELGYAPVTALDHHAHSVFMHEAAVLGLPGALITLAIGAMVLKRAWSDPPGDRYADGTFFVLVGWLVGALFDCYHFNGTMFGLFTVAVALTMPYRGRLKQHG